MGVKVGFFAVDVIKSVTQDVTVVTEVVVAVTVDVWYIVVLARDVKKLFETLVDCVWNVVCNAVQKR